MELKEFIRQTMEEVKARMESVVEGLTQEELVHRPGPEANSIGFILWHVARVEDRWIQDFAQKRPHIWESQGWNDRLGMPLEGTGYGLTPEQAAELPVQRLVDLLDYFNNVRLSTLEYLDALAPKDLDARPSPDARPDFTVARMFRQLIGEENQHLGHLAYIRGLIRGISG